MISPAEFIPVAEDTGLIIELGDWVMQTACARGRRLAGSCPAGRQRLAGPVEIRRRWRCGSRARSPPRACRRDRLELEITEAVLIHDDETALAILHQLRAIGVRIALDDFGTGYLLVELSEAVSVRQDQDRPLLRQRHRRDRRLGGDRAGGGQYRSSPQHDYHSGRRRDPNSNARSLRRLGCTQMQGYLFSAAKPASQIRTMLGIASDRTLASA